MQPSMASPRLLRSMGDWSEIATEVMLVRLPCDQGRLTVRLAITRMSCTSSPDASLPVSMRASVKL